MKKKVISILIIIAIIIGVLFAIATAGTGKLFTNLSVTDQEGIGYGIGDPIQINGKYIWELNQYNSNNITDKVTPLIIAYTKYKIPTTVGDIFLNSKLNTRTTTNSKISNQLK